MQAPPPAAEPASPSMRSAAAAAATTTAATTAATTATTAPAAAAATTATTAPAAEPSSITNTSVFVADPDAPVYDVPVSVIHRPIPSVLDPAKVQDFACKLQEGTQLTPIEVAWVEHEGQNYYFAFGGCHRWAAHKQLGSETIPARLIKTAASDISVYLGASSPFRPKT